MYVIKLILTFKTLQDLKEMQANAPEIYCTCQ